MGDRRSPPVPRASFTVSVRLERDPVEVLLRDLSGPVSITNDADAVVVFALHHQPKARIFYIDTMGACDELCHDGARFTGFAPARGRYA